MHLFINWKGVRAVKSRSLNRQRANIAFSALFSKDEVLTPKDISEKELIFERRGGEVFRWNSGPVLGYCKYGVPLESLLQGLANSHQAMRSFRLSAVGLAALVDLFEHQEYILWCQVAGEAPHGSASKIKVMIVLKDQISPKAQLKAWFHGLLLARRLSGQDPADLARAGLDQTAMLSHIQSSLQIANEKYEGYARRLSAAGWNLEIPVLETRSGSRVVRETDEIAAH